MPAFGPDNKRWAQRAQQVQFSELSSVRATAEQWRNGLAGLTALLSAAALISSPSLGTALSAWQRTLVGLLALAGLLTLIFGTWRAMLAAFGVPGAAMPLTGERLKKWEQDQSRLAVGRLNQARIAFLGGILLIVAASAVAYWAQPSSQTDATVVVTTTTGAICGHLGASQTGELRLTSSDGHVYTLPLAAIKSVDIAASC